MLNEVHVILLVMGLCRIASFFHHVMKTLYGYNTFYITSQIVHCELISFPFAVQS